jgi:hypothetical protein
MKKFKPQNAYLPLALLLAVFMAGCNSGGGGDSSTPAATDTPDTPDTTAPTVTLTVPAFSALDVAINTKVVATFSEDMTAATLSGTTFTVTDPSGAVAGEVTYADDVDTAIFTPTATLAASTIYTATITTGAKDLAGNPLEADKGWTFTTGTDTDIDAPTLVTRVPVDLATGVRTTQSVSATFNEPMDPATITAGNFTLEQTTSHDAVEGTLAYSGTTVILPRYCGVAVNSLY